MTIRKLFLSLFKGQPEDPSWRFVRAETASSPSGKAENKLDLLYFIGSSCADCLLFFFHFLHWRFTVRQCVAAGCAV